MNVTAIAKATSILPTIRKPDLTCSTTGRESRFMFHILCLAASENRSWRNIAITLIDQGRGGIVVVLTPVYNSYLSPPSKRFGPSPSLQWDHGGSRVLPLQAVDRRRGEARLLDHDRNGPHAGSLGRSPGRLGAAARDCRSFRRSADLRLTQIGDVLAQVVLLLRASEDELPRSLRVPRPHAEGSSGTTRRSRIEAQNLSHHSDQASRRGRGAHH